MITHPNIVDEVERTVSDAQRIPSSFESVAYSSSSAVHAPKAPKKKLVRRATRDHSQKIRRGMQIAFLILNVWIGVQFYMFVRWCETAGQTMQASRPAGVEGWLPIAALMNLKLWIASGELPSIHPAGMFLLIAFLGISFAFRKAFCSWLCPVGTLSEGLWKLGKKLFKRNWQIPRLFDIPLRGLKYLLLALFGYAVVSMSAEAIRAFLAGPYGVVADVKMLNFFRYMGETAAIVIILLVIASVFVQNFWCRYLCPYGALMGFVSMLSPLRIRRNPDPCIDCGKCAKACPSLLPVDQLITIKSAECTGCLECVAVCPAEGALMFAAPRKKAVPVWAVAAGIAVVFLGLVSYAKVTNHWNTNIPQRVYMDLVPKAAEFEHP
jgi:polyferredoxin